jgi:hypothetical protein
VENPNKGEEHAHHHCTSPPLRTWRCSKKITTQQVLLGMNPFFLLFPLLYLLVLQHFATEYYLNPTDTPKYYYLLSFLV